MSKLPKHTLCTYCSRLLERHHYSQHIRKCFMKPDNLQLIAKYFQYSITNTKLLKRKKFHYYCVKNAHVLSPVSMGHYFKQNKFKNLIIQLLIMLYKHELFDWEMAEIIIYNITNGNFYMDDNFFSQLKTQVRDSRGLSQIDTRLNYQALLDAVIVRSTLDLEFIVHKKDENNELITEECILDALLFLSYIKPEEISRKRHEGKVSKDTELLYEKYINIPDKTF